MRKYRVNWFKFLPRMGLLILFIASTIAIIQCRVLDSML